MREKIGFIGAGLMGEALIRGILNKKLIKRENIFASDIEKKKLDFLKKELKINVTTSNKELVKSVDIVVLSVKPQVVLTVASEIKEIFPENVLLISIAAGVSIEFLEEKISKKIAIVRVMPNISSLAGEGIAGISYNNNCKTIHKKLAEKIFSSVGKIVRVEEKYLDAITAISGSGPAYIFLMIEALSDAGVRIGLPRELSQFLSIQTVLGAAKLAISTGKHPGELKDMVCSPAGTTISALHTLEEKGFRGILISAVYSAYKRAKEISKG
jgi:pyrroline-5-carboxylate reductase